MMNMALADFRLQELDFRDCGDVRAQCPLCSSGRKKRQDQCASVTREVWFCHHCGESGKIVPNEHAEEVCTPPLLAPEPAPITLKEELASDQDIDRMFEYLHGRGISREALELARVECVSKYMGAVGGVIPCMAFRYYAGGKVVNVKYRDYEKNFIQTKGGQRIAWLVDDVRDCEAVVICEGEIDALSFLTAGVTNVVSVPDGAPPANATKVAAKMEFLDNSLPYLNKVRRFILATDDDPNGVRLREELAKRLGPERCSIVSYPPLPETIGERETCKDANEVLVHHGPEGLTRLIDEAIPYPVKGSLSPQSFSSEVWHYYEKGMPKIAPCGDRELDRIVRFAPGTMAVITGIPGHGKSTWLDQLMVRQIRKNNWTVSFFTPENFPLSVHGMRLAEQMVGKPIMRSASSDQMSVSELQGAMEIIERHVRYIAPEGDTVGIDEILELAEYHVKHFDINALVIDPWASIEHCNRQEVSETTYIGGVLGRIRRFAQKHSIIVFIVAHPRKMERLGGREGSKAPTLYDIAGSANFANAADYGIVVYRDRTTDLTDVSVLKVKHKFYGDGGTVTYRFDRESQRFESVGSTAWQSIHRDVDGGLDVSGILGDSESGRPN